MPITVNVKPWQGRPLVRRMAAIVMLAALGSASVAAHAAAAESAPPTAQAIAANATWVPYLDPPPKSAAICLVDSGVNVTPDTPADSPEGPIIKRLALDGGTGEAANATWEGLHGTRMALGGVALRNDWGAVGFWPGARVISIRAMPVDGTSFAFDAYQRALFLCGTWAESYNVVAINLALGCQCVPSELERSVLHDRIVRAHANGLSVVAAAGNNAGAVGSPASEPGVVATGAGDKIGALCSFSNHGPELDLIAPGCGLDLADPTTGQPWSNYQGGTSAASMTTSVVIALLRSYRPDLNWESAEHLLAISSRSSTDGPVLDVEALFRIAGLGTLVDVAQKRVPQPATSTVPGDADPPELWAGTPRSRAMPDDLGWISVSERMHSQKRLRRPTLGGMLQLGHRLSLSVRNRPRGARLVILIQRRNTEFGYATVAHVVRAADTATVPLPRLSQCTRVLVRYEIRGHPGRTSPTVYRPLRP